MGDAPARYQVAQEHPSIVSIRFYGQHICGGVFITTRHILTAGHCLSDDDELGQGIVRYPKFLITVASGTNNCYHPANVHKIKSFTIHPHYQGSISDYANDIAIIELEYAIQPDETRQIARLPRENTSPNVDATVVLDGGHPTREKKNCRSC
ncbi:GSCOCT00013139001.2-RA-CDS [Cotesia congregata]|uniref:Serine protease 27-like n=1 Tax=Cotesia congregata TaxID=51543 RepID=A0A8J2HC90_COTCN|nr:GSCOCT00013139001.2-RA-CDS [Cotesia congregata]CAG5093012.1 serine protease 27-like [Cotesia congregata]